MNQQQFSVALAGDYNYIRQIETTLKSLCFHNQYLKVYILNQDIPREWFQATQLAMAMTGCELVDLKIMDSRLDKQWTAGFSHINYMAFARYFIGQLIEDDIVLYLDSDLVVTGDVTHLFSMDLKDNYGAAVHALHGMSGHFNSGVILINNKKWRAENLFERLIETTQREWQNVAEGDQTILNIVFDNKWIRLDGIYNFPIGYDSGASSFKQNHVFDIPIDPLPLILHYISPDKPWNTFSAGRLRHVWWQYNQLEWSTIIDKMRVPEANQIKRLTPNKHVLTITNSQDLEAIEQLVKALPQYYFHIGAYTNMGFDLLKMGQYDNVILYPNMMYQTALQLIEQADVYLDINYGEKFDDIIEQVKQSNKLILAFHSTQNDSHVDKVFFSERSLIHFLKKEYPYWHK